MEPKNKTEVLIGGRRYTLVGEESQEYMQRVALYIDKKMAEISQKESSHPLSTNLLAILTSINVADDLFKEMDRNKQLIEQITKYDQRDKKFQEKMEESFEQIKKLQEELSVRDQELKRLQKELFRYKQEVDIEIVDNGNKNSAS